MTTPRAPERPKVRSDCEGTPRPCPWLGCKYNLLLDVTESGGIIINHGRKVEVREGRRAKTAVKRLPIIGARPSFRHNKLFETNVEKLISEIDGIKANNCLLDLVEKGETYTLEQTGDLLNITRERVRQIEAKALKRARVRSKEELKEWEDYE